jgi:hypothetical protein
MIKVSRQPGQWAEPPAQELGKSLLEQKEKPRRWTPGITRIHRLHWIHRIHPVCWWCYVMFDMFDMFDGDELLILFFGWGWRGRIFFHSVSIERYWKILKVLGGAIVNQIWTIVQDGLFIAGSCFGFGCTAWMSKGWCLACVGVLHQTRDLNVHSVCPSTVNVLLFSSWPSPLMISFLVRLQCLFCLGHHRSLLLLLHCPSQLF